MTRAVGLTDSAGVVERLLDGTRNEKSVSTYARLCREAATLITELQATVARLSANPADQRYWEGRYRDEAAKVSRIQSETIERAITAAMNIPTSMSLFLTRREAQAATDTKGRIIDALRSLTNESRHD